MAVGNRHHHLPNVAVVVEERRGAVDLAAAADRAVAVVEVLVLALHRVAGAQRRLLPVTSAIQSLQQKAT